jgi:hypothetical protein
MTIEQAGEDGTMTGKEATSLGLSDLLSLEAVNEKLGTIAMIIVLVLVGVLVVWAIVCCFHRHRAHTMVVAPPPAP